MTAKLINGNEIAQQIREELKQEVARIKDKVIPGLVTILVGENPASVSYVTAKQKTSKELGFYSIQDNQSATLTAEELLKLIDKYNKDPKIHGILVQLPLPKHINETKVLYAIDPKKDVDGFHPVNGCREIQHCWKTYCQHPPTKTERGQCNGNDLSYRYKRYGFPYEEGGHPGGGCWKAQGGDGRYGEGRGSGHRCGCQSDWNDP